MIITCVVVSTMAFFLSDLIPPMRYDALFLGLSVSAVFFVRTVRNGWLSEGRLENLLLYPVREKTMVAAYVCVACAVFVFEVLIPLVVILLAIGQGTAIQLVSLLVFVLLIGATLFLSHALPVKRAALIGFGIALCLGAVAQYVQPWLGIVLAIIVLVSMYQFPCVLPRTPTTGESRFAQFVRTKFNNYFLVNTLLDSRAWSSFLIINIFAAVLVYMIGSEQGPVRVFWCLACVNTPVTTILSREHDTRDQIRLVGDEKATALRMAAAMLPVFVLGMAFLYIVAAWLGLVQPLDIAFGLCIALLATAISVFLEIRFPLVNVKTERDVFRHPRKYVAVLAAGICIVAYEFTFGAMV
ncbi:hypothetical protein [Corynebacterium sp.]|uniref:hypothetical protein n=1 Tax=Corynebacterium sp. TaxID=1720 RepID=UPI0026DDB4CE|nr:hypothetical protein [Corynebacterium sp.]